MQALLEDIKKETLRKEVRLAKYKESFAELSTAAGVIMKGEKPVLPTSLIPIVLEAQGSYRDGVHAEAAEAVEAGLLVARPDSRCYRVHGHVQHMLLSVSAQTHFAADFKGPIIGNAGRHSTCMS